MSRRILSLMVAVALVAFGASFAVGAVVFDNGGPGPDWVDAFNITQGAYIAADDFSLSQNTTITDVHFWAQGYPTPPSGFSWAVYSDHLNGTKNIFEPNNLLAGGSALNIVATPTGNLPFGFTEYTISFNLDNPLALNANTFYWLVLQSSSPLFWSSTPTSTSEKAVQSVDTSPYNWYHISDIDAASHDLAFQLTSTPVPIPGAVWLFGSGLAGLVGISRRRFKK